MFKDLWVDSEWYFKVLLIIVVLVAVFSLVAVGIDCHNEINEPESGEIYDLRFTPAHTTMIPVTHSFPNGNNGYTYYTTHQTIYNPDSYMVYYRQWSEEENKWLNGDCGVDAQTFHQLNIGDNFNNIN